jgi:predicted AAA+ superfamily ATPase
VDTLLGYYIYPYHHKIKRDLITATPKFYLFDVGIANYLAHQTVSTLKGEAAGRSFEHYILMELVAYIGLNKKRVEITYWRTKTGLEVDFILGKASVAIEVKMTEQVHKEDLRGLIAFLEEHPKAQGIVVSQDSQARLLAVNDKLTISILPWRQFLQALWAGKII